MEVRRQVKIYFWNRSVNFYEIVLIKKNGAFFWKLKETIPLSYFDSFVRWNEIIRPKLAADTLLFSFFDKDLSEDSSDTIWLQENVDSHLE